MRNAAQDQIEPLFKSWPKEWPEYHNACGEPCDAVDGPCVCGATHSRAEWCFKPEKGYLYRNKTLVAIL